MEEYARQMESSNAYLLDLVNNVIDIADMDSQTDDIPKKPVSVDACCQECLGLIRQNLKEGIKLQYMPSSTPVEVCTVEIWMKRVLLGLLNNANKFTESGFIRLSYAEDKPNRLVRFIIEDSGPGIDEKLPGLHFRTVREDRCLHSGHRTRIVYYPSDHGISGWKCLSGH